MSCEATVLLCSIFGTCKTFNVEKLPLVFHSILPEVRCWVLLLLVLLVLLLAGAAAISQLTL